MKLRLHSKLEVSCVHQQVPLCSQSPNNLYLISDFQLSLYVLCSAQDLESRKDNILIYTATFKSARASNTQDSISCSRYPRLNTRHWTLDTIVHLKAFSAQPTGLLAPSSVNNDESHADRHVIKSAIRLPLSLWPLHEARGRIAP